MCLNPKSQLAVSAMIDIALREEGGPVPLTDVARRQQVSLTYLEQLFSKLRQKGLVISARGRGGGYLPGRCIDVITVADIIGALETGTSVSNQLLASPSRELTQDLWDAVNAKMLGLMQSVTLKSLVVEQIAKGVKVERRTPSPSCGVFRLPAQKPLGSNVLNSVFALADTLP